MLVGMNCSFFGCFFGIRDQHGNWPIAWWAFMFLQLWPLCSMPHKVVCSNGVIMNLSMFGTLIEKLSADQIESIAEGKACGRKYLALKKTEAGYNAHRRDHVCFKCCATKVMYLQFWSPDDMATFKDKWAP